MDLKKVFDNAEVVAPEVKNKTITAIGSQVTVKYRDTDKVDRFTLCSFMCFHEDNHVSYASPVGGALLGENRG